MIGDQRRAELIAALRGDHSLSALKALALLGSRTADPDGVQSEVLSAWPYDGPVLTVAAEVLRLHAVGAALDDYLDEALAYMEDHALTREEHFMAIAVVDECGLDERLPRSVDFFRAIEHEDGTFGSDPLQNAIAASALLRAGEDIRDPSAVGKLLLETALGEDLWTTYCAMRALDLLGAAPSPQELTPWVLDGLTELSNVDAVYQRLSILDWLTAPVLNAAANGDTAALCSYLRGGGDPDLRDLTGWTPLCTAAVRGRSGAVELLLDAGADPDLKVTDADGLPVFWAGQSGDVDTVKLLLDKRPEHLHSINSVNGHTVLLQAVFYGTAKHRDLVEWLFDRATPDDRRRMMAACNVRGYTAKTMARLWNNEPIEAILATVDDVTDQERAEYKRVLLASIAPVPEPATDVLIAALADVRDEAHIMDALAAPELDVNRRGGPLSQTPVIAALTGTDPDADTAEARLRVVSELLRRGADPDLPELHPMGVDAVIRAAVLNHFACLREIARFMAPLAFAAAMNERPAINGQTALDDTVHRALTAPDDTVEEHLAQIRWAVAHGARSDIPDFTGVTVAGRARAALDDPLLRDRALIVLAALGETPFA
jgi:ankyrin repeat protein